VTGMASTQTSFMDGNGRKDSQANKLERQNAQLKAKLSSKDEVIAEIMASHIELKKSLGEI
jgi:hypothetical protein